VPDGSNVTINDDNSVDVTLPDDPAEPVDPPTEPVDPPTEPVDPPTEPVDPPTEPVDPPTEPVDPPTEPVDPPTEPVDPPTEPVDPPTEPVDPPTEPVDPPVEQVEPAPRRLIVLPQWPGRPCDARFSPGGTLIATRDCDAFIDLRDQLSGVLLHRLAGRFSTLDATLFSEDDGKFYVGTEKGTIHEYDTRTGQKTRIFDWHDEPVARLILSPEKTILLSLAADGEAVLWNLASGEREDKFFVAPEHISSVKFDQNGVQLIYVTPLGKFQVRNVDSGETVYTAPLTVDRFSKVRQVDFNGENGRLLVVVDQHGDSSVAKLWNITLGNEELSKVADRRGKTIARLCDKGTKLLLWSDESEPPLEDLPLFEEIETSADIARFSPDGKRVIAVVPDGEDAGQQRWLIKSTDIETGDLVWSTEIDQECVELLMSSNARRVFAKTRNGAILLSAVDGKLLGEIQSPDVAERIVRASPGMQRVVLAPKTTEDTAPTELYDLTEMKRIATLGRTRAISRCQFNPDGDIVVIAGTTGGVSVWDLQTGRRPVLCEKGATDISVLEFFDGGKRLLIGGKDLAQLWDTKTWEKIASFKLPDATTANAAAMNHDGTRLVIGTSDQTAAIYDVATAQRLQTFDLAAAADEAIHDAALSHVAKRVAFTPDRAHVAAQVDCGILLFEIRSGGCTWAQFGAAVDLSPDAGRVVIGKDNKLSAVRLSNPDGEMTQVNRVSIGGSQRQVWESRPVVTVRSLFEPYAIRSVRISANGTRMISYGDEGIARIWDIESGERLHEIKNVEDFARQQPGMRLGTRFPIRFGKKVWLWDARHGDVVSTILAPDNPFDQRTAVAFSDDAEQMIVGYDSGYAQLYDKDGLAVTLFADESGSRWIAITPEGDYECAEESADLVGYRDKENHFSLGSATADTHHNPANVIARIAGEKADESGE